MSLKRPTDNDNSLKAYLWEIRGINPLSRSEEIELARIGGEENIKELIRRNLKFVVMIASKYKGMGVSVTDLINEGNIGMIHAARRFDPDRGVKFITYAVWWIRQAILQALADQAKVVRVPIKQAGLLMKIARKIEELSQKYRREPTREELAMELKLSVSTLESAMRVYRSYMSLDSPLKSEDDSSMFIDMLESNPDHSVEGDFIRLCLHHDLEKMLGTLTDREEMILRLRYGFDEPPMTLDKIGKRLKLTRERVRQIEKQAKEKLRSKAGVQVLEDYLH